jgi:hypothetical protein
MVHKKNHYREMVSAVASTTAEYPSATIDIK